jgi:hypothetical protein
MDGNETKQYDNRMMILNIILNKIHTIKTFINKLN